MPEMASPAVWHTMRLWLRKDPRKRVPDGRDVGFALSGSVAVLTLKALGHESERMTLEARPAEIAIR